MVRIVLLTLAVACAPASGMLPSPGCKRGGPLPVGDDGDRFVKRNIIIQDFEHVERRYWIELPPGVTRKQMQKDPSPVLLAFHGQTGDARDFGQSHNFSLVAKSQGTPLVAIFPQGIDDAPANDSSKDQGTGWNVGSAGKAGDATCVPEGVGTEGACYESCRKQGKCGRCNWSTCYDDVLFVESIIKAVSEELCVNLDRIYVQGESNGAMFVQHLVRERPGLFAGATTWFGTPMLGFLLGSSSDLIDEKPLIQHTAILALHGRNDTTIPAEGGSSADGWLYEPLDQATAIWALMHGCQRKRQAVTTKWDGGPLRFSCTHYPACRSGRAVMQCMYDGVHGDWPTGDHGDEISLWFLSQFSRERHPPHFPPQGPVIFS